MEENILKNGTRVISFAPDSESTNELGVITDSYQFKGKTHYDVRTDDIEEDYLDLDFQERGENFELVPTKFVNLTPHDIKLNDGTIYPATGKIARVENTFSNFCCGISKVFYGENLPEPEDIDLIFQNIQIQLSLYKNQEIQSRKRNIGMENLETS